MNRQVFKFCILLVFYFVVVLLLINWKSSDVNHFCTMNLHQCIYSDPRRRSYVFDDRFYINLVENSGKNCLNPYFPSIHISASQCHNAWLHIVYTDSQASQWRTFIDAASIDSQGSAYPFYMVFHLWYLSVVPICLS